eukprot:7764603-Alexandrium_andersonii.AAC.1
MAARQRSAAVNALHQLPATPMVGPAAPGRPSGSRMTTFSADQAATSPVSMGPVSYTHLRAHETSAHH